MAVTTRRKASAVPPATSTPSRGTSKRKTNGRVQSHTPTASAIGARVRITPRPSLIYGMARRVVARQPRATTAAANSARLIPWSTESPKASSTRSPLNTSVTKRIPP